MITKFCKPFLIWVGGKSFLLSNIMPMVPEYPGRYIEPFTGGGAVFFAMHPDQALLSDSNAELVLAYQMVRDCPQEVMNILRQTYNEDTREFYYCARAQDWKSMPPEQVAARMIYLNRTCFRGEYRTNRNGEFNTPYGNRHRRIYKEKTILRASEALQSAEIVSADFRDALEKAHSGDFIFLDPPYPSLGWRREKFTRYTPGKFSRQDHIDLADGVRRLAEKGCYAMVTVSDSPFTRDLYSFGHIHAVNTHNCLSGTGERKQELIITTY